jgi:hypothetical protein
MAADSDSASNGPLPDEAVELFAVDPADFIAARDEVVRALRSAGRRDDARRVKSLRRPTLAVWSVNQLGRRDGELVARFAEVSAALAAEQRETMQGTGDSDRFRSLVRQRRELVEDLASSAACFLDDLGANGEGQRFEIVAALEAVSSDAAMLEQLRVGCFTSTPTSGSTGFGELGDFGALELGLATRSAEASRSAADASRSAADSDESSKPDAAGVRRAIDEAQAVATRARRVAHDARAARDIADARLKDAEAAVTSAEAALADARRERDDARASAVERQQLADSADDAAQRAEQRLEELRRGG